MIDDEANAINQSDLIAIADENKELRSEIESLRSENAALAREIELLEIALSEPKQRRRSRHDDD